MSKRHKENNGGNLITNYIISKDEVKNKKNSRLKEKNE